MSEKQHCLSQLANHNYSTKQIFSRFNTAVATVFFLVVVIAFVLAAIRYFGELSKFEHNSSQQLLAQAAIIEQQLEQNIKTIKGLQEFANYQINNPSHGRQLKLPLAQQGSLFYLDLPERDVINQRKRISVNITGLGDIAHFDIAMQQELAMAYALTPSFVVAQHSNPIDTWFYYVSERQFVSLYPWIGRQSWHYSEQMTSERFMTQIKLKSDENQLFWSPAFQDTAGKGLMASIAAGVHRQQTFIGALVIDINLALLSDVFLPLTSNNQGFVLLDQDQHVLVDHSANPHEINMNTALSDVLPEALAQLLSPARPLTQHNTQLGDWLVSESTLNANGWRLVQYQHYDDFIQPLFNEFLSLFLLVFLGLLAFIGLIYWLTRNTFIKPATEFIQHIEYCAQGDPGKIKPNADWLHWFKIVEDIFSQNRSLLQQLKDQNNLLDQRVNEKTSELRLSIVQHQRDYALLRSVMNAIPELIIFSDSQGNMIGCNSVVERFLVKTEHEMYGQNASALMPERLGKALQKISTQAYQDNEANAFQNIVWAQDKTFELFSCKFFDEQQQALGTINIFRDVSQQYESQSALEAAKNQAESANKAKSQFLANMSHEIRTPLNAIQGMMFLLARTSLNTVQQQYLTNADIASKSLIYLIDELLDLSRIESGKISLTNTEVTLDSIVEKALKLNIDGANKKQLSVLVEVAANVPHSFISDEIRLVQVLTNLVNNAVKFTERGQVKVTITCTAQNADESNALVKFSVKDSGIGIAKQKQSKLFEAFTQADESMTRKYGGSGLGLSICKLIVNLLGGDITLKSELGFGSEFSFVLPLNHSRSWTKYLTKQVSSPEPVLVCSYGFHLTEAVVDTLTMQRWHYLAVHEFERLFEVTLAKHSILLVDVCTLQADAQLLLSEQWLEVCERFERIGLCLPMMSALAHDISHWFDSHQLDWFIVEQPIYRSLAKLLYQKTQQPVAITSPSVNVAKSVETSRDLAGKTLLLVEDNLVNQLVAKELLASMNATVIIADNGQRALDILAQQTVDAVLMDIQMPVMDGLTAARTIRQQPQFADLPIVAMTAHAREHDQQQSIEAGMNRHIAKPVSYDVLLATLLSVLAQT